ncbi:Y-family DNA polymerase [Mucilaginibacter limnophilus]|uniref:Y-family DNA polymerase n=1 Tax=Mucilaginibacter limnophilus TaxID=1932778 RepID=A0A3S2WYR8_9SPHI|nr:Y-family DNA polymerase [Mucilaginibacter limnophilus]RVU01283.1 Y-family DNA polymerase [Mucilaginibacter limnophilus]
MFALCDCNNFYASAERLFRPELCGVPVVVLSNNDGCVIARSEEAKLCGIKMGDPEFLVRDQIKKYDIKVFSSNYVLYGDMSERVMENLSRWFPRLDVYSIDEAFGRLDGVQDLHNYIPKVRASVVQNTGIPVSIGVGPTKTLAKLANKIAKKNGGTYILDTPDSITKAVNSFPIDDLWGIGRQYLKKINDLKLDIKTVGQLRELPEMWFKKNMTVQGQRMWNELWGRPAINIEDQLDSKKAITVSRSFRNYITEPDMLSEAVTTYASRLAEKLRREGLRCTYLQVFMYTNEHREDHPQHFPTQTVKMAMATNTTHDLVKTATVIARKLFKQGMKYRKAGVIAKVLMPESELQLNMFNHHDEGKLDKISAVLDHVNLAYGRGTVRMASEGYKKAWRLKHEWLSKGYTTRWHDIIKAK